RWDARLRIMYIYGTYIPPFGGASLSLTLSSSHQAQNIITKPFIAPSYDLSHIFPIFSTCTTLLSTAPLLCLSYCNPSCCPLATLAITKGSYATLNMESEVLSPSTGSLSASSSLLFSVKNTH